MIFQKEKTVLCRHLLVDISILPATSEQTHQLRRKKDDSFKK
jgi:hypothetical protein